MMRIYRSRTDRKITGLCGGLADLLGIDATWLRLLFVVTAFFSGGIVIALYFLATLVIPSEPWPEGPYEPGYGAGGGFGQQAWGKESGRHFGSWKEWKRAEKYYRKARKYGWAPPHEDREYEAEYRPSGNDPIDGNDLDERMKDIEKKAMWKEIEELRAKVAQYEKQNQAKGEM